MALIGPGANKREENTPTPTLEGASEYEYVTILNPLTDDFGVEVAQDIPANLPFNIGRDGSGRTTQTTITERDAAQTYGLSLRNPDFQGKKHVSNVIIIKAGETINLKGDEAQVAVRQLVNEIAQQEGKKRMLADPVTRKEIEERIIVARGSVQQLMDNNLVSPKQQVNEAIQRSNEVQHAEEPAFPGIGEEDQGPEDVTRESGDQHESRPEEVAREQAANS